MKAATQRSISHFGVSRRDHVEFCQARSAFAREPAQYRIDQAGKVHAVAVGLHEADGEIDRRMIGHIEKQDLRRPDQQRGLDARRVFRQAALQHQAKERAQGAEPPQHDRDQRPDRALVAIRQPARPDGARAFSCSSSGRCRRSTPSTMSAATPDAEAGRLGWRFDRCLSGRLGVVLAGREAGGASWRPLYPIMAACGPTSLP
jgi:hypothetical protein